MNDIQNGQDPSTTAIIEKSVKQSNFEKKSDSLSILGRLVSHTVSWSIVGILLGIIGAMIAQNSYVSEIQSKTLEFQEKKAELQNLLYEVEKSKNLGQRFNQINNRLITLENYLKDIEKIQPYYNEEITIPASIDGKRKIITSIRNSELSKSELVNYISQKDDPNISKIAFEQFSIISDEADIDFIVKTAIADNDSAWLEAEQYLSNKITEKNYKIFEKSFIKYVHFDDQKSSLLIKYMNACSQKYFENSLLRIRKSLDPNNSPYTQKEIDSKILNMSNR